MYKTHLVRIVLFVFLAFQTILELKGDSLEQEIFVQKEELSNIVQLVYATKVL